MSFSILHSHSDFSARDSLLRATELPKLAKSLGWEAVALTDHGSVEGTLVFMDACKEAGIRGLPGCEIYVSVPGGEKHHHLTVIPKSAKGWSSLMRCLSAGTLAWKGGRKRTTPTPVGQALELLDDVVVLSGCFSSPFWRPGGDPDLGKWVEKFGEDFFFEVQPLSDWEDQITLNHVVAEAARHYGRLIVATPDCHYANAGETKLHEALLAFANRAVLGSARDDWKFSTHLNYPMTPEAMARHLSRAGFTEEEAVEAVATTAGVAARVGDWSFEDLAAPRIPEVEGDFVALARAGFAKRGLSGYEYESRLEEELRLFMKGGLAGYFLLVHECVRLIKEQGALIGPRGSVGGSLIAYCLGITSLDPVEWDIPYWRFWHADRPKTSMPDIDLDLALSAKKGIPELLTKRFGTGRVAQISTVATFGIKAAARAAAKTYGLPEPVYGEYEEQQTKDKQPPLEELIAEMREGIAFQALSPDAQAFALALVGKVEKYGAHPGGFVIAREPLTEGRGCVVRRGKTSALCWDMEDAERLGYLKIDFLGNSAIDALEVLSKTLGIKDVETIPLEDPAVFEDFKAGRTAGIPQFSTPGMRTFAEMVRPETFEDVVWMNAAYRPGGLGQGGPRELAAAYRENPESVIVYQEDVMRFCVGLAGFSWADADAVRKIVAKSKGARELAKWRERFVEGCRKAGVIDTEAADVLFDQIVQFGRYAFPRGHAASYSAVALRIAWAKRRNPVLAYAALLNIDGGDGADDLLDEAREIGVEILPPDPNESTTKWEVVEPPEYGLPVIFSPLQAAEGADGRIVNAILARRKDGPFKDRADFTRRMGRGVKVAYVGKKDGKTKFRSDGIQRPPWFDERLWNPSPRRTEIPTRPAREEAEAFREVVRECDRCPLRATCKAPVPPEFGRTNVLVLGEAPGFREDMRSRPFVGKSGELLMGLLETAGVSRSDLLIHNRVSCKFPSEDKPEIDCPWAGKLIVHFKPPLVLAVGSPAWKYVSGLGKKAPGITSVNGKLLWSTVGGYRMAVVPSIHPAAILRDERLLPELERAVRKFASVFKAVGGVRL